MRRMFAILGLMLGVQFPAFSYASEVSYEAFDVRPVIQSSTDAFSVFQILVKARNAYEQKDFEQAAKDYSTLVQYDSALEEAVIGLAKSYLALQQPSLAKNTLSASPVSSRESDILLVIATAQMLDKNEAKPYLLESVKTHQDSRLWNFLGHILMTNDETQSAAYAFNQAEKLGQNPGLLYNNLGMLAFQTGELNSALQYLDHAVNLSPNTLKFDNNRRLALLLRGQYLKALENISSQRGANLLTDAAIIAAKRGEDSLEILLRKKSNELNPVFNPLSSKLIDERPG